MDGRNNFSVRQFSVHFFNLILGYVGLKISWLLSGDSPLIEIMIGSPDKNSRDANSIAIFHFSDLIVSFLGHRYRLYWHCRQRPEFVLFFSSCRFHVTGNGKSSRNMLTVAVQCEVQCQVWSLFLPPASQHGHDGMHVDGILAWADHQRAIEGARDGTTPPESSLSPYVNRRTRAHRGARCGAGRFGQIRTACGPSSWQQPVA